MTKAILKLDANEGRPALSAAAIAARIDERALCRYPDARPLEEAIAARLGLGASRVLATAGADDAIDRAVRRLAGPGGAVVAADPSFVEYQAAAARSGARYAPCFRAPGSPLPLEAMLSALEAERDAGRRALAIVTSPDNPGGTTMTEGELEVLAASGFPVLLDLTYAAFAERGPGAGLALYASELEGVVSTGTLSKAYGLAGLRIGWACGPAELVAELREAGPPFSLSTLAIAAGLAALEADPSAFVAEVRRERRILEARLASLGAVTWPGEANFVTARVEDAPALVAALEREGVLVRSWPERSAMGDFVRITCPGERGEFDALLEALEAAPRVAPMAAARAKKEDL